MASGITSDGKTVTVTTDAGHTIGFGMAELNASRTSGNITTKWGGGMPPKSTERTVAAAKIEAEAFSAQNHASAPGDARDEQNRDKGVWSVLQSLFGLQWRQKEHDSEGVLEAATEPRLLRRRDHLLPLMVERQAQSRVADRARNILAKHHHAIADVGPSASQYQGEVNAKRQSDRGDRNIERIRSTQ